MKIARVISGGQTGVDQAALFAARAVGIRTGGTAPLYWSTEIGSAPWLKDYGLVEDKSLNYPAYTVRTRKNVANSHCTLIMGNQQSPGSRLTRKYCYELGRPAVRVSNFDQKDLWNCIKALKSEIEDDRFILNVAGNRESVWPGITEKAKYFLIQVFQKVNNVSNTN